MDKSNVPQQQEPIPQQLLDRNPQYQKNLRKFFGVDSKYQEPQEQVIDYRLKDPKFQKNLEKFFGIEEEKNYNKVNQNDPSYQKNLKNFFGDGQLSKPIPRLTYEQANKDPKFQQNLIKYFGADDNQILHSNKKIKNGNIPRQEFNNPITQDSKVQQQNQGRIIVLSEPNQLFLRQIEQHLRAKGINEYEVYTLPGGGLSLLHNQDWLKGFREFVDWFQNVYQIYLTASINSEGTRIYLGLKQNQQNPEKVMQAMMAQMLKCKNMLSKQHHAHVNGIILDSKGIGQKVF